jgi:hypothetical protein
MIIWRTANWWLLSYCASACMFWRLRARMACNSVAVSTCFLVPLLCIYNLYRYAHTLRYAFAW